MISPDVRSQTTPEVKEVKTLITLLGFHPERRHNAVRLRKRHEALAFEALTSFRKYPLI
jgi:hypothetical protein